MKSIFVFCGSSDNVNGTYLEAARQMGALAAGAMEEGGEVHGVIPAFFNTPQLAEKRLTKVKVTPDMHSRKARMAELADGFVALPGGYGTLEELFEMLTWGQIGLHAKPVGLLNTNGYFDDLVAFLEHVHREGIAYAEHREIYCIAGDPTELIEDDERLPPAGQPGTVGEAWRVRGDRIYTLCLTTKATQSSWWRRSKISRSAWRRVEWI